MILSLDENLVSLVKHYHFEVSQIDWLSLRNSVLDPLWHSNNDMSAILRCVCISNDRADLGPI